MKKFCLIQQSNYKDATQDASTLQNKAKYLNTLKQNVRMFRVTLSATQLWEEQSTRWLWNKSRFHFKDFEWCRARPSPTWCVALSVTKCDEWKLYLLWNEIDFVWRWLINAVAERRTWRSKTNLNRNVAVLNCQKWISGDVIWNLWSTKSCLCVSHYNAQYFELMSWSSG